MRYQIYFLVIFLVSTLIFLVPYIHANDGAGYYSQTRSLVVDHDLDLKNEHDYFEQSFNVNSIQEDNLTGLWYSQYPIGVGLLQLPFVGLVHLFVHGDGYSMGYIYASCLSAVVFGFLGLWICFIFCRRYFDEKTSFVAVLVYWLSSNLFYYMFLESSLSHAYSFFATSLFIYYFFTMDRSDMIEYYGLGLISALMVMVRYQDGIFLLIPIYFFIKDYFTKNYIFTSMVRNNFQYFISFLMGMSPQLMILLYQHKSLSTHYQYVYNFWQSFTHFFLVLFSNNHGLFLWTPIALIGILSLFYGIKSKERDMIISLLIVFVASVFFIAGLRDWHSAQAFGCRYLLNCGLLVIFGLCYFINHSVVKMGNRFAIAFLLVGLVCWNFLLIFEYGMRLIPSAGPVNFLAILPNLWNYLINFIN